MEIEMYRSKTVKTRKPTKCFLCYVKIEPGTLVDYESGKFDGAMFSRHSHPECAAEWIKQNADSEYDDEWSDRLFYENPIEDFRAWQDMIRTKYPSQIVAVKPEHLPNPVIAGNVSQGIEPAYSDHYTRKDG